MAEEKKRVHIAVPKETAAIVEELAERFDETNGKIVKIAVAEFAKKVNK